MRMERNDSRPATRILLYVLAVICIFIIAIILAKLRPSNRVLVNQYATSDVVYADGTTAHFESKDFGTMNKGDTVTVHLRLPKTPILQDAALTFYIYHSVTEVVCNGRVLSAYGEDLDAAGKFIGNARFIFDVPEDAWGGEITIKLRATEDLAFSQIKNLGLYPRLAAYQFYIDSDVLGFFIGFPMLIFGLVGLLLSLIAGLNKYGVRRAMYISLFVLLAAVWILANEGMFHLLGMDGYFWSYAEFVVVFFMDIPILLYAYETIGEDGLMKKLLKAAAILQAAFFLVSIVLNDMNISHYSRTLPWSEIITLLAAGLLLSFAIRQMRANQQSSFTYFFGMLILFFTGIFDIVRLNLFKFIPVLHRLAIPSVLSLGILFFSILMLFSFYQDTIERQRTLLSQISRAKNAEEFLAQVPAGICMFAGEVEMPVLEANTVFYNIFGYASAEDAAENGISNLRALFDEPLYESIVARKDELIGTPDDTIHEYEFVTRRRDNSPMWLYAKYKYNKQNRMITVNIIDISERKRMEDELRIREEDYRTAIEASDHYYLNYDVATKNCTYMFDAEKLFGISGKVENIPESLIALGLCAPESVADYREAFRMLAAGVPSGEFCLHLQNFKTHEFRWYGGGFRTVFDANGSPLHTIAAFKDVTEQREKEIAYTIHKQRIESHSEDEITYFELSLTTGMCDYSYGAEAKRVLALSSPRWDEMVDHGVQLFVCPEDRQEVSDFLRCAHLLELYGHGVTEAIHEYRGYRQDGDTHWLRISVSIASDSGTHEVKAYCSIEDIEAEKAAELERQTEQQRSRYYEEAYEKLASSVMYGVCKYSADNELSIVFANDIFYKMHGYASQEEAVAAGFTSILFATPPFGKELVRAAHREYTDGKAGQLFETEYPSIDANGNRIWILCRGVYSPEEGMFNSSVLNITDRKHTEEQLRVSEERYRLALSQSGKVFFFFDVPTRTMRLSDELAQAFGLPNVVDNMPDNYISQGLVEPQSVETYRHFYERIIAGEPSGDAVISCHMRQTPEQVLWYRIAFTSVFDAKGVPQSAIVTYEDLQEQRAREIAGAWKQLNLLSVPESKYVVAEYNLTQNRLLSQVGGLFAKMPDFVSGYDEINAFVIEHFIYEEDVPAYRRFLDRQRVLAMFEAGEPEDSIEYRSLQSGSTPRWTSTSIQMIRDLYSGDVLAQMLFMDIHAEKVGQIEMEQNVEELKKKLENSRIKVMINQMQPHFLYNALSAIQTIVKTDPDYAYQLIYDFTVHLRSSIKALSSDAPISFRDELKNIKAYLNIERMRFGDSLQVRYEIDCDSFSVIPLSIQPLAENAARHGVYPKGDEGGTVTVRTYETVNTYVIEVEDDGVGFDVNNVLDSDSDSVGLKSLIFRLKSLMDADVAIVSKLGVGTKATVTIPKKEA